MCLLRLRNGIARVEESKLDKHENISNKDQVLRSKTWKQATRNDLRIKTAQCRAKRQSARNRQISVKVKEEENKKIKREKVILEVEQEDKSFAHKTPFEIKLEHNKPKMLGDEDVELKIEHDVPAGAPNQLLFFVLFCFSKNATIISRS